MENLESAYRTPEVVQGGEQSLLSENGVHVTASRIVVGSSVTMTRSIESSRRIVVPPKRGGMIACIVFGAPIALAGILTPAIVWTVAGGALLALAVKSWASGETFYGLIFTTSGGGSQAVRSTDKAFVDRVDAALNHALSIR